MLPDAKKALAEQVSSVAERRQLDAAIASGKANHARLVGDLLAIVARLEAKKVSPRVLSIPSSQALDTSTRGRRQGLAREAF